jgi:hypothetical protein
MRTVLRFALGTAVLGLVSPVAAAAQPVGSFAWQTQPYCNRIVVAVTQVGATYTLDGYDDQCGGANPRAPLTGAAAINPDGSIGFGLNIVTAVGRSVHMTATITLAALSGTWRDDGENAGTFAFNVATGGPPRPRPGAGQAIAAALVDRSGPVFRHARNFSALTRPATGIYCLTPALPPGLTLADVYSHVTVEWGFSAGSILFAYPNEFGSGGCVAGQIPVHTYALTGSPLTVSASNSVSFDLTLFLR